MYGEFLQEASPILGDDRFKEVGDAFVALSLQWDDVAKDLWQLSQHGDVALLDKMALAISHIHDMEKKLYLHLFNLIR